jgi:hypothetical protein
MEALLEKEGDVENWNDERLDELSGRMDDGFKEMRAGFDRLGKEMKEGFGRVDREMKEGFLEVNKRIDRLMLTLVVGTLGMLGALLGVALT